jgi:hypothetical protein
MKQETPAPVRGERLISDTRGATLVRWPFAPRKQKTRRDGALGVKSQPHSLAGTVLKLRLDDTFGRDNGGVSGPTYSAIS